MQASVFHRHAHTRAHAYTNKLIDAYTTHVHTPQKGKESIQNVLKTSKFGGGRIMKTALTLPPFSPYSYCIVLVFQLQLVLLLTSTCLIMSYLIAFVLDAPDLQITLQCLLGEHRDDMAENSGHGRHSSSAIHPSNVYKIFLTMFAEFPYISLPFSYI